VTGFSPRRPSCLRLIARLPSLATPGDAAGFRPTSCRQRRRVNTRLGGVAQAGQEGIDAFEQRGGVLVELAGGDEDVVGQPARLVGGLACARDVDRDFAGAGGGLLHASRNLARRRVLLLAGGRDGGADPAAFPDGVAGA